MTARKGGLLAFLLALAMAFGLAGPALSRDGGDTPPDSVMSTKPRSGDTLQSGQNEQGDSVMRIEHTPREQTGQSPRIGPIMVVPEVKQGGRAGRGGTTVVPVPVAPNERENGQ